MLTKEFILAKSKQTLGWLDLIEAKELFRQAYQGPQKGEVVEIGSFVGKSTICLAGGSKIAEREKVYAIDPHIGSKEHQPGGSSFNPVFWDAKKKKINTYPVFMKNMKEGKVDDYVISLITSSEKAAKKWKKKIRLLFIDGAHDYGSVKKDLQLWLPFLHRKGNVLLHDYNTWEGPTKAANEIIKKNKRFCKFCVVKNLLCATKI